MTSTTRRDFLKHSIAAAALGAGPFAAPTAPAAERHGRHMAIGLVTYTWGADWDLPTLIANCEQGNMAGVELRTTHRHGVEPGLSPAERAEVKKRVDDSPMILVGPGSNERFDSSDPDVGICWISSSGDHREEGFEHNFDLLKDRFGATVHIRELDRPGYPWQRLVDLLVAMDYRGHLLLECTGIPADTIAARAAQARLFREMVSCAAAEA